MKFPIVHLLCLSISLIASIPTSAAGTDQRTQPAPRVAPATASAKILGVDEFMQNVERFKDPVRINGVVSGVWPSKQMIALIDVGEFKACKVTTCARLMLPVSWSGPPPKVQDTVQVEGAVQQRDKKLIFVARALKKLKSSKGASK